MKKYLYLVKSLCPAVNSSNTIKIKKTMFMSTNICKRISLTSCAHKTNILSVVELRLIFVASELRDFKIILEKLGVNYVKEYKTFTSDQHPYEMLLSGIKQSLF